MTPRTVRWALYAITILAVVYTGIRFAEAGIRYPLSYHNLGQIEEQTPRLREHIQTGKPVDTVGARQYGPVFFFVMDPLLRATDADLTLIAPWLYGLQLLCLAGAFVLTWATLRRSVPGLDTSQRALTIIWLGIIWLNFAPMYTILVVKNVETWELFLIVLALYAYLRGWLWLTGVALAAGGLIKLLPFVFLYYLVMRNRVAFAYACAAVVVFLLISHLVYGPEMGLRYLPNRASATVGPSTTWALDWHENVSLKGVVVKLFGRLDTAYQGGYFVALGERRPLAIMSATLAQLLGGLWLTWTIIRTRGALSAEQTVWEWSLVTLAMLILSPQTAFEYTTLSLGALSYAFVRLVAAPKPVAVLLFGVGALLLGTIVPRSVLNQLTGINAINNWTGYTHLTPSEAYQYYGFPLLGLLLLVATLWQLRPAIVAPTVEAAIRA